MSASVHACGACSAAEADEGPEYGAHPELAVAAVLNLLSRFPARQSPVVAQAIIDHLRIIEGDARLAGCVRDCAAQLVDDWRAYAVLSAGEGVGAAAH